MGQVSNEEIIRAVFSAKPDAKARALDVLLGREGPVSTPPAAPDFFTISQACSWLSCSRMTLYRMEQAGEIRSVHLRGKKLFERAELLRALKRGKEEA